MEKGWGVETEAYMEERERKGWRERVIKRGCRGREGGREGEH